MFKYLKFIALKEATFFDKLTEREKSKQLNIVLLFTFIGFLILAFSSFYLFEKGTLLISIIGFLLSGLFSYKQYFFFKYIEG